MTHKILAQVLEMNETSLSQFASDQHGFIADLNCGCFGWSFKFAMMGGSVKYFQDDPPAIGLDDHQVSIMPDPACPKPQNSIQAHLPFAGRAAGDEPKNGNEPTAIIPDGKNRLLLGRAPKCVVYVNTVAVSHVHANLSRALFNETFVLGFGVRSAMFAPSANVTVDPAFERGMVTSELARSKRMGILA
jgi:hypothetical protein